MGLHRGEDSTLSRLEEALVNDGEWHHLQLDISSVGGPLSHHKAVLSLDQGLYLVGSWISWPSPLFHLCLQPFKALCGTFFLGQYGGGREAARVQVEDGERGRFGNA